MGFCRFNFPSGRTASEDRPPTAGLTRAGRVTRPRRAAGPGPARVLVHPSETWSIKVKLCRCHKGSETIIQCSKTGFYGIPLRWDTDSFRHSAPPPLERGLWRVLLSQPYRESKESFVFPAPTASPGAKEKAPPVWRSLFALPQGSFRAGSANGTYASTCAALDAGIRIDDVFAVALRDRADGAFCRAGAASDAFIRNLICHGQIHLLIGMPLL